MIQVFWNYSLVMARLRCQIVTNFRYWQSSSYSSKISKPVSQGTMKTQNMGSEVRQIDTIVQVCSVHWCFWLQWYKEVGSHCSSSSNYNVLLLEWSDLKGKGIKEPMPIFSHNSLNFFSFEDQTLKIKTTKNNCT